MPAVTPLSVDITGAVTHRTAVAVPTRTMPNTLTLLATIPLHPADVCDLLIVGHASSSQSGTIAREARIDLEVRLNGGVIGVGAVVSGSPMRRWYDDRFGQWMELPFGTRQSQGLLASAIGVPAGPHTLTIHGTGWSTTGNATITLQHLSVSVIEFYR